MDEKEVTGDPDAESDERIGRSEAERRDEEDEAREERKWVIYFWVYVAAAAAISIYGFTFGILNGLVAIAAFAIGYWRIFREDDEDDDEDEHVDRSPDEDLSHD